MLALVGIRRTHVKLFFMKEENSRKRRLNSILEYEAKKRGCA